MLVIAVAVLAHTTLAANLLQTICMHTNGTSHYSGGGYVALVAEEPTGCCANHTDSPFTGSLEQTTEKEQCTDIVIDGGASQINSKRELVSKPELPIAVFPVDFCGDVSKCVLREALGGMPPRAPPLPCALCQAYQISMVLRL